MPDRNDYTVQKVADVFNNILDRDGVLDPELMHDEFADANHPLHARYEWDDKVAGRKHRVQQIRNDVRLVRVQFINRESGEMESVRAYSSLKYSSRADTQGYVESAKLIAEDPIAGQLLQRRLMRQIATLRSQFGHLGNFIEIVRSELLGEEVA